MFGRKKRDEVAPQEAARLQKQGSTLLDVREPDEWGTGHAPHAVHVPLAEVGGSASRFDGQQVLVVCRSGVRSAKAAKALAAAGIDARNVVGGMNAWSKAGLPVVRDDGSAGAVA
jgi:rhodanese-related sulfurtransferase